MSDVKLWRFAVVHAMLGCLLSAMVPRASHAEPASIPDPPVGGPGGTVGYVVVNVPLSNATRLTNGQLTGEQWTVLMNSVLPSGAIATVPNFDELVLNAQVTDGYFPPPVGPDGKQVPPPIKLPEVEPGQPNPWKPIPGTPARPIKWIPTFPIPGQSQPGGSWDSEDGHWDVDNGLGERVRCTPEGRRVGLDHVPTGDWLNPPEPFEGLDLASYAQVTCLGCDSLDWDWLVPALLGVIIVVIIIVYLIYTFPWGWVPALCACALVPPPS